MGQGRSPYNLGGGSAYPRERDIVFSSATRPPRNFRGNDTLHTDLYIFRRDAPRRPWKLVKKVPLPRQKQLPPVSYRTPPDAVGVAEVWMVEAASEEAARAQLEADIQAKAT